MNGFGRPNQDSFDTGIENVFPDSAETPRSRPAQNEACRLFGMVLASGPAGARTATTILRLSSPPRRRWPIISANSLRSPSPIRRAA